VKHRFSLLLLFFLISLSFSTQAQNSGVGIGTTTPDASAALDIVAPGKGALLPRISQAARLAIAAPAAGLIVYQTDGAQAGFWYNAGSAATPQWLRLIDSNGVRYDPATGLSIGVASPYPVLVDQPAQRYNFFQPFRGDNADNRVQFVLKAADLLAAGLHAGQLTGLALNVISKASTQPYQNFTLRINPTTRTDAIGPYRFDDWGTVVFTGALTTQLGWNALTFSTPLQWDGSSNLLLHFCYDNAAPLGGVDVVEGYSPGYTSYMRISDANGPAAGCSLPLGTGLSLNALPAIRWQLQPGYTLPAGGGSPGQVLVQQPNGNVSFQTPAWVVSRGQTVLTDTTRRVGVGTTRPQAQLDIRGGADYNGGNDLHALAFSWRGGGYRHWLRSRHNGSLLGGGNALDFYLNNSSHADSSRTPTRGTTHVLTLDNNSGPRVGVGVSNPISLLANTASGITGSDGTGTFPGALTWATNQPGYAGLFFNQRPGSYSHGLLVKVASTDATATAFEVAQGTSATGAANSLLTVRGNGFIGLATAAPQTRLSITPTVLEPKITLWDGNNLSNHYGFGITDHQLNYHVATITDSHIFFAGGKNGDGVQLLRLQGNGFVGVGSAPALARLYVHSTGDADRGLQLSDGSLSNIIVQGLTGNNSGFQAINFNGYYNAGEQQINPGKHRWRIGVDQRGSSDALFIDSYANGSGSSILTAQPNGNIGLGMSPSYRLDVNGQLRASNVSVTSDQRLKANIRPLSGTLTQVRALRGVRYTFRREEFRDQNLPTGEQVGVLAQEVEKVYPELVSTDTQGFKSVNYAQLTPVLIEAVKELATENEQLRAQAASFEQRLQALESNEQ
jgi:hypothetical protein